MNGATRWVWICAVLGLCTTAPAEDYDDPAVVVCEAYIQKQDVVSSQKYTRKTTSMVGLTVTVEYTTKFATLPPKAARRICTFRLVNGKYQLQKPTPPDDCKALVAEQQAMMASGAKNADAIAELLGRLKPCAERLKAYSIARADELTRIEMPLAMAGVLPISPDATKLRPE